MSDNVRKRTWRELPQRLRASIIAVGAVEIAVKIAALVDINRRPAEAINGSKRAWRLALLVNPGELGYFLFGRKRSN